jgi:hypothetical protein
MDPFMRARIDFLGRTGWTPSQVRQELERLVAEEEPFRSRYRKDPSFLPRRRTIERAVKDVAPRDMSPDWTLADEGGEGARNILDVLGTVIEFTRGRKSSLSRDEVRWVRLVQKAAPSLAPLATFEMAREFQRRTITGEDTRDLDSYLALRGWEGDENVNQYLQLVADGVVKPLRFRWVLNPNEEPRGTYRPPISRQDRGDEGGPDLGAGRTDVEATEGSAEGEG